MSNKQKRRAPKGVLGRLIRTIFQFYPVMLPITIVCIVINAVVSSIPSAIIGGVSFILYGMISAVGVRNVVENQVDFTNSRNLIIAAVILVCGLGFSGGLTFTIGSAHITLTSLAIAAIAGIALNAILPGKDYEFGVNPEGDKNQGIAIDPAGDKNQSADESDEEK